MKKQFVLFDFDGVIADSFHLAFEIQKMICPHITHDLFRKRFEGNINDWEEPIHIHNDQCRHDIDFFTEYVPRMNKEVCLVQHMKDIIIELEKTYTLVVISSTITSPIQLFLESHNLASHFVQIMGNDVHKSKVEKIKMVFAIYTAKSHDCVFITDTLGDMREATHAGVGSIGVTWGFHLPKTLLQGKPFSLVKKPNDLLTAIPQYFDVKNG